MDLSQSSTGSGNASSSYNSTPPPARRPRLTGDQLAVYSRTQDERLRRPRDVTIRGPLYPIDDNSILLFDPVDNKYDPESNPNGVIPVVLHPQLQEKNGKPLTDVQVEGVRTLWNRFNARRGHILAHEMGLGKTRTTISVILTLLKQKENCCGVMKPAIRTVVVLAQKNVVPIWIEEFEKWRPDGEIFPHVANLTTYSKEHDVDKKMRQFASGLIQVLVLTYDKFKKHQFNFRSLKSKVGLLVCDEAHCLRNSETQRSHAFNGFPVEVKFGLTGTPYQNNLEEFCNICQFFQPGILPNNYKKHYCRPIKNYLRKNRSLEGEHRDMFEEVRAKVAEMISYKWNQLNVDKHEVVVCVHLRKDDEMGAFGFQHDMYRMFTDRIEEKTTALNTCQHIDLLKKLCIHPQNFYKAVVNGKPQFNEIVADYRVLSEDLKAPAFKTISAKIYLLIDMLRRIFDQSDDKVVIASYSVVLLKHLRIFFSYQHWGYVEFTGDTDDKERDKNVEKLNTNPNTRIMLLSGKSGGTGLNLNVANHMFLMDPDWNPSNDKQAIYRIYRQGQTKPCYIYRILSTGTIEESTFLLQLDKEDLGEHLRNPSNDSAIIQLQAFEKEKSYSYYTDTPSYMNDKLEELHLFDEPADENEGPGADEDQFVDVQFARSLAMSRRYRTADDIPNDLLPILKESWHCGVTFAFHSIKLGVAADMQQLVQ